MVLVGRSFFLRFGGRDSDCFCLNMGWPHSSFLTWFLDGCVHRTRPWAFLCFVVDDLSCFVVFIYFIDYMIHNQIYCYNDF